MKPARHNFRTPSTVRAGAHPSLRTAAFGRPATEVSADLQGATTRWRLARRITPILLQQLQIPARDDRLCLWLTQAEVSSNQDAVCHWVYAELEGSTPPSSLPALLQALARRLQRHLLDLQEPTP
jgi:hypothetical protein